MRRSALGPAVGAAFLIAACFLDGTGPSVRPEFSQQITFEQFTEIVAGGAARLEIEILPLSLAGGGPPVADEVEVQGADELADEESVEGRVTALAAGADAGTLTLELEGIEVGFTTATEFEAESGDHLTFDEFVARVQAALDAGNLPAIEGERDPPASPQDPDDGTFAAAQIKLDDEAGEPELELNVDGDNLLACSTLQSPPAGCLGVLRVLGVSIALVDDVTELEAEVADLVGEVDFEGVVQDVDRAGTSCVLGTVTLKDGTIIRLVAGTELENESGDDEQLDDLCEVEEALASSDMVIVEADGEGVVESTDPLTIVAIEVEFSLEDEAEDAVGGGGRLSRGGIEPESPGLRLAWASHAPILGAAFSGGSDASGDDAPG